MTLLDRLHNDQQENQPQAAEVIQPAVQEKNVRRTTFILVAAVIVVFAGLLLLNKKSSPSKAAAAMTAQQVQIETAIAQLTGIKTEGLSQVDRLVNKFYEFADSQQVLAEQLKRNPFILTATGGSGHNKKSESTLNNKADSMQLLSIMQSKYGNCCMIDDMLLYEGDKIEGFEVVQIGDDFVKLNSKMKNIILYLQNE